MKEEGFIELLRAAGVVEGKQYKVRIVDRSRNVCVSDDEAVDIYGIYNKVWTAFEWLKLSEWYFYDVIIGHNNDIYIIAR